jgi:diacylglycerol kinase (ATP)
MKHLFIVNPVAGGKNVTQEVYRSALQLFSRRRETFHLYVTKAPMDAADKVRREAEDGELMRVYSCGGDGTLNECVCGAAGHANVAVAPYAIGTGNDFSRLFGKERELYRNLEQIVKGTVHPIDLLLCNGRPCINICSVGFDARIGTQVGKYKKIPVLGGATGYVTSLAMNYIRGITQHMRIWTDGFREEGEYTMVCICNGRYYGGGFNPIRDAVPDDGIMNTLVVKAVSRLKVAELVLKYAKGRYAEVPQYVTRLDGTHLHISLDRESVVNIDGESLYAKEIDIRLLAGALNLIAPQNMTFPFSRTLEGWE